LTRDLFGCIFLLLSLSPWWFFCLSGIEGEEEEKVVVLAAWHVGLRSILAARLLCRRDKAA
jgi:hypothetical protein